MATSHTPQPDKKADAIQKLNKLYGNDNTAAINQVNAKLNLPGDSPIWLQITEALENRNKNYAAYQAAMTNAEKVLTAPDSKAVAELSESMQTLQGKFIAMMAAKRIPAAVYHAYPHGEEMSTDPGNFLNPILPKNAFAVLVKDLTNMLGAAHDIVQGKGAPTNERESAVIFVKETQQMLQEFVNETKLSNAEVDAIKQLSENAAPFLAEEGITNATYLLFGAGNRDFDNVINQIHAACSNNSPHPVPEIDPLTAGMKLAITLSDTRRAEMTEVLQQQVLLKSIPKTQLENLEKLLQASGLLEEKQTLANASQDKRMEIEGFLLRVGQNIRMTSEIAIAFAKPGSNPEDNKSRQLLIENIRQDLPVTVDHKNHITPFIDVLKGEASFAEAIGDKGKEIIAQANASGLEKLSNTMNFSGWPKHAEYLRTLQKNFLAAPEKDQQAIGEILFHVGAKPPGYRIRPETYKAMEDYQAELSSKKDKTQEDQKEFENLSAVISEAKKANNFGLDTKTVKSTLLTNGDYQPPTQVENLSVDAQARIQKSNDPQQDVRTTIRVSGPGQRGGH